MKVPAKPPMKTEAKSKVLAADREGKPPFDYLRREVDGLFENFRPVGWPLTFPSPSAFELAGPRAKPTGPGSVGGLDVDQGTVLKLGFNYSYVPMQCRLSAPKALHRQRPVTHWQSEKIQL